MNRLNIQSLVSLTHKLIPGMIERGSGKILNIASVAGFQAMPGYSTYAATKAYVILFSEAIHLELAKFGIQVGALCPGPVMTEFFDVSGKGKPGNKLAKTQTAQDVVDVALNGMDQNQTLIITSRVLRLWVCIQRILPRPLIVRIAGMK